MFSQYYVVALLRNLELANAVWTLWNLYLISDEVAMSAWLLIAANQSD